MIRRCVHCGDWIDTTFGADPPSAHPDTSGMYGDPHAPGDWDDVCAPCGYGKGLPSLEREGVAPAA